MVWSTLCSPHSELVDVDPQALMRWDLSVPRYTSYPTAPQFYPVDDALYRQALLRFDASDRPLSIYLHIPFCQKMCLFCGCSVVLNRSQDKQKKYLDSVLEEIRLLPFAKKRRVTQLHLGGGTPTSLNEEELAQLMKAFREKFILDGEISIEIDPRTVFEDGGKKLKALRELGWNRVSFGVQDLDPLVQEAVKRRQTEEMTVATYTWARELGFLGINLDLIYGLPHQNASRFSKTIEKILEMKPDRIALFSYAKVPWLKLHQKAIPDELLPTTLEKFTMYTQARKTLMQGGYEVIGMDHFSLPGDSLAVAYGQNKLIRNFQGYSVGFAEDMLGLGMSSIGRVENIYFQNRKTIAEYEEDVSQGLLPVGLGYVLNEEDKLRSWVIQKVMCHFAVNKKEFLEKFFCSFDLFFAKQKKELDQLQKEGLIEETEETLIVTSMGKLLVRLVAAVFDAYLGKGNYSRAI